MSAAGAPWRAGHDAASTSGRSGASSAATGTYGLRAGTGPFAAYAIHSRYGTSASITLTPHSSVSAARHLGARADDGEHDRVSPASWRGEPGALGPGSGEVSVQS